MSALNTFIDELINGTLYNRNSLSVYYNPHATFSKLASLHLNQKTTKSPKKPESYKLKHNQDFADLLKVKPNQGYDLIVHGSVADKTLTAFSDFDDLVILKSAFFTDFDIFRETVIKLRKLNLVFQRFDITQHHGHWLVPYYELDNYDQAVMPLVILNDAFSVTGSYRLSFRPRVLSSFSKILSSIANELDTEAKMVFSTKGSLFNLKNVVGCICLSPALLFQESGSIISKKKAISQADLVVPKRYLPLIGWSSQIRKTWHLLPTFRRLQLYKPLAYIFPDRTTVEYLVRMWAPKLNPLQIPNYVTYYPNIISYADYLKRR